MENKVESFQPMPKRFMVWDKEKNEFLTIFDDDGLECTKFAIHDLHSVIEENGVNWDEVIIVQSTNLFDKDGKEIFEGSIVINDYLSYPDHKKGKTIQAAPKVVTWDPKTARFVLNANPIMDLASRGGNNGKNLTVIGHILSNPELMEKEDV